MIKLLKQSLIQEFDTVEIIINVDYRPLPVIFQPIHAIGKYATPKSNTLNHKGEGT